MSIKLQSSSEAHYTVYKLTDPYGKIYIGCTGQQPVEKRWLNGKNYCPQIPIGKAIRTFGWENFRKQILCEKLTKEGAEKLEGWFVEYYDSMDPEKGYNRHSGGARKGSFVSEATKECDREAKKKFVAGNTRHSTRLRSAALAFYSRQPEAKEKISRRMHDYLLSPAGRAFALSSGKAKPVRCVETGEEYPSQNAAEKATGLCGIHKACSGLQTVCGGYHWVYIKM